MGGGMNLTWWPPRRPLSLVFMANRRARHRAARARNRLVSLALAIVRLLLLMLMSCDKDARLTHLRGRCSSPSTLAVDIVDCASGQRANLSTAVRNQLAALLFVSSSQLSSRSTTGQWLGFVWSGP